MDHAASILVRHEAMHVRRPLAGAWEVGNKGWARGSVSVARHGQTKTLRCGSDQSSEFLFRLVGVGRERTKVSRITEHPATQRREALGGSRLRVELCLHAETLYILYLTLDATTTTYSLRVGDNAGGITCGLSPR